VSIRDFDAMLAFLVDGRNLLCTMADTCCQYLVVEHNGDVYPCDFFVQPDLLLGNIMHASWEQMLDSTRYLAFGKQKQEVSSRCRECEFFSLCRGDCPRHRFTGVENSPDSRLCEGWQLFYAHALPRLHRIARSLQRRCADAAPASSAPVREAGRNEPCPCGSGRKFKHCHGR
jgi:uncharacterized protein